MLVSAFVGPSHFFDVIALANAKSSLVMAGLSNSIWSDNLGLEIVLKVVHGRLESGFVASGVASKVGDGVDVTLGIVKSAR